MWNQHVKQITMIFHERFISIYLHYFIIQICIIAKANGNNNKNLKLKKAEKNVSIWKFDVLVINSLILSM